MKKSLLVIAAVAMSMAANAQSTWLNGVTAGNADDAAAAYAQAAALEGTAASQYVVKPVEIGAGLTLAKAAKDERFGIADYVPYFQPVITEGEGKTFDKADKTAYVAFYEETDEKGTLETTGLTSVQFKASRVGTDAVRMQAVLQVLDAAGSVEWTSGPLITADNASAVLDNGVFTSLYEDVDGDGNPTMTGFEGMQPARNKDGVKFKDGEKGADGTTQPDGNWATTVTLPVPANFPTDAWNAKLVVYIYGIHNNKQAVIHSVKFLHNGETGISAVTTTKANANAPIYNLAGQQVNKNYKGVVIQNGKKFIQ